MRRSGVFKELIEELRTNDMKDGQVPYLRFSMRNQNLLCSRAIEAKRFDGQDYAHELSVGSGRGRGEFSPLTFVFLRAMGRL